MPFNPMRQLVTVVFLASLAACASKPASTEKPVVRKIALIPATEPLQLTLENQNAVVFLSPITSLGFQYDSKVKAKLFNEKMATQNLSLAPKLTTTVVDSLRSAGYQVEVLEGLARSADDPDDIDYEKIKTDAEVIVQLRVKEVGMFSSRFSNDYLPRVNVDGKLYIRSLDDSIYDETLYYGADAKEGKASAIIADRKFAYPTFEVLMSKPEEVRDVFENATLALARLLAKQLRETLVTKTRPAR